MTLYFEEEGEIKLPLECETLAKKVVEEALDYVNCPYEAQVNLLLTENEQIHEMNREFRGIDRATDVLSFPMIDYPEPGYQQHQQVILLVAALDHVMQMVPLARMDDFRTGLLTYIETQDQALCRRVDESGQLSDEDRETILKLSREFLTRFQTEAAEKSGE